MKATRIIIFYRKVPESISISLWPRPITPIKCHFLCEPLFHKKKIKIEEVRVQLGFEFSLTIYCNGRSEGSTCSLNFINVKISSPNNNTWCFTGYYWFPDRSKRRELMEYLLKSLAGNTILAWCIMDDLNGEYARLWFNRSKFWFIIYLINSRDA